METGKMKQKSPQKHIDSEGVERYWAWTHRMPLAIEGRNRNRFPKWHAFKTKKQCVDYVEKVDSYSKINGEVGFGLPPKVVIENWNYESHFEPWE